MHHNAVLAGPATRCIEVCPISTWQVSSVSVRACMKLEYAYTKMQQELHGYKPKLTAEHALWAVRNVLLECMCGQGTL